ncbi:MAG: MBL fold metallo-hydrolase, partial [Planctomycetota bacterium]|nr:MBL fold metallo-hydrolase [Planctomycetota bacterium]
MILEQFYLGCLSQASYLIGDPESGLAAVVDPRRDIDDYLQLADQHGLEIRYAVLTHFHADFASGHLELAERCGATICLGEGARPEYPFRALQDGETIELGRVRLKVVSTPGHTP